MEWQYSKKYYTDPEALFGEGFLTPLFEDDWRKFNFKIDTGADVTVVPKNIGDFFSKKINPSSSLNIKGSNNTTKTYPASYFSFSLDKAKEITIKSAFVRDDDLILLGRDVLNHFILHADGPAKIFKMYTEPSIDSDSGV
ncbi:hypothetical protein NEF87_000209 [Candidatus Lokiarchaeum ossiferum]|uniref:Peptidase A2 domain-containing protein n=1 Tax=Candidatus Lokiarchaeum ossiferum TaxID=2951803 RepID=A0ABY6HMX0_9ARCH|nr:hypothetical protein NEF87_000209 [Candidatus Lokiarchaeum sp. B-35]